MSDRVSISTHVLDTALGLPAAGVAVTLERVEARDRAVFIAQGVTDADGRVPALVPVESSVGAGAYRLSFDVTPYFAVTQRTSFYSEISVTFTVGDDARHYHVPLLLSPFGYSTYRGS